MTKPKPNGAKKWAKAELSAPFRLILTFVVVVVVVVTAVVLFAIAVAVVVVAVIAFRLVTCEESTIAIRA